MREITDPQCNTTEKKKQLREKVQRCSTVVRGALAEISRSIESFYSLFVAGLRLEKHIKAVGRNETPGAV